MQVCQYRTKNQFTNRWSSWNTFSTIYRNPDVGVYDYLGHQTEIRYIEIGE